MVDNYEDQKSLAYSLHRLAFMIQRISDEGLQKDYGIGFSQFKMMLGLAHNLGCEQRVLANYLNQTEAGISRQLRLMKSDGLVEIKKDKNDSRKRNVYLTAKAQGILSSARGYLEQLHAENLMSLTEDEAQLLSGLITKLLDSLKLQCSSNK